MSCPAPYRQESNPSLVHSFGRCIRHGLLTYKNYSLIVGLSAYTSAIDDNYLWCVFLLSSRSCTIMLTRHLALPVPLFLMVLALPFLISSRHWVLVLLVPLEFAFYAPYFLAQTWICWTPNLGYYIGVSCNLIDISNASPWVETFFYDNIVLKCGVSEATNHAWCYASVNVILASWIILFSLWSRSQGVLPGISTIPAFGWSLECLIYHVNVRSCSMITNVSFLILSSMTPYASHTALTMNQNWSRSSFPTPMNTISLISLSILNRGGGRGGVGGDGDEGGETGGDVGGGGKHGILCLIKLTTLLGETFVTSCSLSHEGEIKGLFSNSSLLPLL